MKEITKLMINEYKVLELGYDFMGYRVTDERNLSYHHLVVPKRRKGNLTVENGAILVRKTSHDYLHIIEQINKKAFNDITREMTIENRKKKIDMENIRVIDEILTEFEEKYDDYTTKSGLYIIKDTFRRRLLKERD